MHGERVNTVAITNDVALVAAIVRVGACVHPARTEWANIGRTCPPSAPTVGVPAVVRDSLPPIAHGVPATMDDQWAELAREVPGGWGGMILEGWPVIYLVDTTKRAEVAAVLAARGALQGIDPGQVRVRQARWDFAQLYDWYRYLNLHVWSDSGLVMSDIDEAANRITYGVLDEAARRRVERLLAELHLPCFLVTVEVTGPFWPEGRRTRPDAGRPSPR
ncbi:MAG TPA: hypothetical protein VFU41_12940 [Gemmatimonadales bacterium]|nr:hypothetical protein [Gemmatimonadales bacterium]